MLAPDRPSFDLRGHPPGSPLDTALWLLRHGLWPVPVRPAGKAPLGPGWGLRRPSPGGLAATYAGHPGAGVGVLLGPAGGVVDLEVDDPAAAAPLLARLFPGGPPPTAGWQSPRGRHWLFRWHPGLAGLPAVVHPPGGGLELRLGGPGKQVMSVCPPTPGPDGAARRWDRAGRVLPLPDAVLGWARENREPSG
ncbi:MAG: bifunctional DNA primase/polymerase, partial [Gemmataceae bacterium]|nr:bifunctional DNA primase/polymerase [Gemmataceae bacterium]